MSEPANAGQTGPKPYVFVVMPFKDEFNAVYTEAIEPAAAAAGAHAERLDKQIYTTSMYGRLVNQLAKADLIVADVSEENPNVFYEVGYAHALNKEVFLITNGHGKFHFDVQDRPHIVYRKGLDYLKRELTRCITHAILNPSHATSKPIPCPVEVMLNGIIVPEATPGTFAHIPLRFEPYDNGDFISYSTMQIRNLSTSRIAVDRVYWLSCDEGAIVPIAGNVRRNASTISHGFGDHGPPYRYRYAISKEELKLPVYDTAIIDTTLWRSKVRTLSLPCAIEVLANDRSYRFDFMPIG